MIDKVFDEKTENFYWLGFLIADACFDFNKHVVSLEISVKDVDHLYKFCRFINYDNKIYFRKDNRNTCSMSKTDHKFFKLVNDKLLLSQRKTYNCPTIDWIHNNDLFISFVIGLIDGDGNIRKVPEKNNCCAITIEMHKSQCNFLQYIIDRICYILDTSSNKVRYNCRDYVILDITKRKVYKYLKNKAVKLKLPFLERKWKNIDENFIGRNERIKNQYVLIKQMFDSGNSREKIATELNISYPAVCFILRRISKGIIKI